MTAHDEEKMAHFRSCTPIEMLTNSLRIAPGFIEAQSSMKLFRTQLNSLHFNVVIDYEHILYFGGFCCVLWALNFKVRTKHCLYYINYEQVSALFHLLYSTLFVIFPCNV